MSVLIALTLAIGLLAAPPLIAGAQQTNPCENFPAGSLARMECERNVRLQKPRQDTRGGGGISPSASPSLPVPQAQAPAKPAEPAQPAAVGDTSSIPLAPAQQALPRLHEEGMGGTPAGGPLAATLSKRQLVELLDSRNYQELDRVLTRYQQEFEQDPRAEHRVFNAFEAFATLDPAHESLLIGWTKAYPGSYASHLALGVYYYDQAWEARGGRWATETSQDQFKRMEQYFIGALRSVTQAQKLNPKLQPAYYNILGIMGGAGIPGQEKVLATALEACPTCLDVRIMYIRNLAPRWGGSHEAMDRFAREAQAQVGANPALKTLLGYSTHDRAWLLRIDKRYGEAAQGFTQALSFGETCTLLHDRAACYYQLRQYPQARTDLERCRALPRDSYFQARGALEEVFALSARVAGALGDTQGAASYRRAVREYSVRAK